MIRPAFCWLTTSSCSLLLLMALIFVLLRSWFGVYSLSRGNQTDACLSVLGIHLLLHVVQPWVRQSGKPLFAHALLY